MRTAVLISGQMRTFAACVRNQNWHLYRRLGNPAFFVSCANDEQAGTAELLREFSDDVAIEVVEQPTLGEPSFDLTRHAPYEPAIGYDPATVVQGMLRQLWHRQRVWDFFRVARKRDDDFGIVVRLRPDLLFQGFVMPDDIDGQTVFAPWKATCGGVNDRLGVMGYRAAEWYFTLFSDLPRLLRFGCPLHPESLLQAELEYGVVNVQNTLLAEFTTLRMNGDNPPMFEYPGELARFIHATVAHR